MSAALTNLPPLVIPAGSPLVPEWAYEAVRRLNLITGAGVEQGLSPLGGYGAGAWAFGDQNAKLILPSGFTGNVALAKLTPGGTNGAINFVNGRVTAVTQPS